jgi:hypothetical protein
MLGIACHPKFYEVFFRRVTLQAFKLKINSPYSFIPPVKAYPRKKADITATHLNHKKGQKRQCYRSS